MKIVILPAQIVEAESLELSQLEPNFYTCHVSTISIWDAIHFFLMTHVSILAQFCLILCSLSISNFALNFDNFQLNS